MNDINKMESKPNICEVSNLVVCPKIASKVVKIVRFSGCLSEKCLKGVHVVSSK
jgi:hypothetical protein